MKRFRRLSRHGRATSVGISLGLLLAGACEASSDSDDSDMRQDGQKGGSSANAGVSGGSGKSGAGAGGSGGKAPAGGEAGRGGAGGKGGAGQNAAGSGGEEAGAGGTEAGSGGSKAGSGGTAAGSGSGAGGQGGTGGTAAGSGGGKAGAGGFAAGGGGGNAGAERMKITVKFKAVLGDEAFACGRTYGEQGSTKVSVTPQDLRLFVQDLALIKQDGSSVPVELEVRSPWQDDKVALLDFEDNTGNCIEGTPALNTEITGSVPPGTYTGVSFANGVPEEINHKDPATVGDPLKAHASLSWGWLTGFRFIKAELSQVAPPGQTPGLGLVHPGAAGCSGSAQQGTVMCTRPNRNKIVLNDFDVSENTVVLDAAAIFAQTDLAMDAQCHSSGEFCGPMFSALGIDFGSGKPKDGQSVYSVE